MVNEVLNREQFVQKYILMKSSGKMPLAQVMKDAETAYQFAAKEAWRSSSTPAIASLLSASAEAKLAQANGKQPPF